MTLADHRPYHLYKPCGHKHKSGEFATRDVPSLGPVCAVGLVITVCAACCIRNGMITPECLGIHNGSCVPCPRRQALEKALKHAGQVVPSYDEEDFYGMW